MLLCKEEMSFHTLCKCTFFNEQKLCTHKMTWMIR